MSKNVENLTGRSELKSVIFRVGLPPKGLLLAPFPRTTSKSASFELVHFTEVLGGFSQSGGRRESGGRAGGGHSQIECQI